MNIFNQFSYPIIIAFIIAATIWLLRRGLHLRWHTVIAAQGVIAGIALATFLVLRPIGDDLNTADDALRILQNGKPTFLEFFSQYCTGCLALQPLVETITTDIEDEFNILRIDIHSSIGRDLRRQLVFSFTPEFILFNTSGEEVWRAHLPPAFAELALVTES
jgi:thiol-disulfide isomerase/thioredoxin